jgi:hypothetical protein
MLRLQLEAKGNTVDDLEAALSSALCLLQVDGESAEANDDDLTISVTEVED